MGDTLTLEESFAQAQAKADDSTLKEEPTKEEETPAEETKEAKPATPENLEAKSETELERIDPEKLPPELKSVYKDLMKGFTQGRQKDSERAKAAEEKARLLEERLAKIESGINPSQTPQTPQFKTVEEYYDYLATTKVEEKLREEKINSYREQALNDYEAADERLRRPSEGKENPAYDEFMDVSISGKLDELLAEHVAKNGSELGFDHKSETKKLIEQWEDWMQGRIKSYIDKQNQLVKTKAGESRAHNPKTSPGKSEPSKPMSLAEALEAAQSKLKS